MRLGASRPILCCINSTSLCAPCCSFQLAMPRFAAWLDNVADFDGALFRLSRPESQGLDPQSRKLLEGTWMAVQVCQPSLHVHTLLLLCDAEDEASTCASWQPCGCLPTSLVFLHVPDVCRTLLLPSQPTRWQPPACLWAACGASTWHYKMANASNIPWRRGLAAA